MTLLWLIAWLLCGTPHLSFIHVTGWTIAMCICMFIDLTGSRVS